MTIPIQVVEVETNKRDCHGCYFSQGNRWLQCPEKCVMSTTNNAPVIYKKRKGHQA